MACGNRPVNYGLCSSHTPVAPLFNNPQLPPRISPALFRWWMNKGLYHIRNFLENRGVHPSSYLCKIWRFPLSEYFHLQQIHHFLHSLQTKSTDLAFRNPVRKQMYTKESPARKHLHVVQLFCFSLVKTSLSKRETWVLLPSWRTGELGLLEYIRASQM